MATLHHARDAMDAQALQECVRGTDVFARAYPQHKPRLVKAIQANGLFSP